MYTWPTGTSSPMQDPKYHSIVDLGYWTCFIDANESAIHELVVNNHEPHKDLELPVGHVVMDLRREIVAAANSLLGRPYYIDAIWGIYTDVGQSVMAHSHWNNSWLNPDEYFSFCYYPCGDPEDAPMVLHIQHSNRQEILERIPIEPGKLVIFRSYYQHMTERQIADKHRVSIAGNLYPVEPNGVKVKREPRQGVLSDDLWQE